MPTEQDRVHALDVVWGVGEWCKRVAVEAAQYGAELQQAVVVLNTPVETVETWRPSEPSVRLTPNQGGVRPQTFGIVLHSTRGGQVPGVEYQATINWFMNEASQVSAHMVISREGEMTQMVPWGAVAWHAGWELNHSYLGVELEQGFRGEDITEKQYIALAKWVADMEESYGALSLIEHKDTAQGKAERKSDVGPPFSMEILWGYLQVEKSLRGR